MRPKFKGVELSRSNKLIVLSLLDRIGSMPNNNIDFALQSVEVHSRFPNHAATLKQLINKYSDILYFHALPITSSRYRVPVQHFAKTGKLFPNSPVVQSFTKASYQTRGTKLRRIRLSSPVQIVAALGKAKPHEFKRSFYTHKLVRPFTVFVIKGTMERKNKARQINRRG